MNSELIDLQQFLQGRQMINEGRVLRNLSDLVIALNGDASHGFWEFDTECIHSCADDYRLILNGFKHLIGRSNEFEIVHLLISSTMQVHLSVRINKYELSDHWNQIDDWVSDEFLNLIARTKEFLHGGLVELKLDQVYRVFYFEALSIAQEADNLISTLMSSDVDW